MGKKMILREEVSKIDETTGEIITKTSIKAYKDKTPSESYFKIYPMFTQHLGVKETSKKELQLFMFIALNMNYDNEIILDDKMKTVISEYSNVSKKTINNRIYVLMQQNYLKRINKSRYILNPNIVGKGNQTAIENLKLLYNQLS